MALASPQGTLAAPALQSRRPTAVKSFTKAPMRKAPPRQPAPPLPPAPARLPMQQSPAAPPPPPQVAMPAKRPTATKSAPPPSPPPAKQDGKAVQLLRQMHQAKQQQAKQLTRQQED